MNDIVLISAMLLLGFIVLAGCTIALAKTRSDTISTVASGGMAMISGLMAFGALISIPSASRHPDHDPGIETEMLAPLPFDE